MNCSWNLGPIIYACVVCILAVSSNAQSDNDNDDVEVSRKVDGSSEPVPFFRIYENNDKNGLPCVLVSMNVDISIEPKRQQNKKKVVKLPMRANAKGNCGHGFDSRITITWNTFQMSMHFQKSRVSDAWYVDVIELSFNTSDKDLGDLYSDAPSKEFAPNSIVSIRTDDPLTLFLTPIGRSFSCTYPAEIKILDSKKVSRVTFQLRNVRIQPFASMTQRQFGDAFRCPSEAGRRDDTVPFAVGMTLAVVVVGTVGGYAGYRYFKIKKIEYDTME